MNGSGEFDRIARLAGIFDQRGDRVLRGIGDDAAVVRSDGVTITAVDAVVDGVHFKREYSDPSAIGHKAAASALSDLAAMGVEAGEIYIAAGLPDDFSDHDFDRLVSGLERVAATAGATAAGGDLCASPVLWLSVTVVGHAADVKQTVAREGAMIGDLVAVTGLLGASAAGLLLLNDDAAGSRIGLANEVQNSLRDRQLLPTPRLGEGVALARCGATAMVDVSDGLGRDADNLGRHVDGGRLRIDLAALPVARGVKTVAKSLGIDDGVYAASSAEEYELLCTLPAERFDAARTAIEAAGNTLTAIGAVVAADPNAVDHKTEFLDRHGRPVVIAGYDHFN